MPSAIVSFGPKPNINENQIPVVSCAQPDIASIIFPWSVSHRVDFTDVRKTDPVRAGRWLGHLGGDVTDKPIIIHTVHDQILYSAIRIYYSHGLVHVGLDKPLYFICIHESLSKHIVSLKQLSQLLVSRATGQLVLARF
jgi:hypothetical protein